MSGESYNFDPYIGKIDIAITSSSSDIVVPSYLLQSAIKRNLALKKVPRIADTAHTYNSPSLQYTYLLLPNGGVLTLMGMIILATSEEMQEEANNVLKSITGDNIETITIAPVYGDDDSVIYMDSICTNSALKMSSFQGMLVAQGTVSYSFSYIDGEI